MEGRLDTNILLRIARVGAGLRIRSLASEGVAALKEDDNH